MPGWWVLRVLDSGGPPLLIAWIIWVVVSITLHELAHGWAAIRRGDTTPIDTGHMTWNPLVHMGGPSLLVFALTGIAWGMMPVDTTRMRGKYADAAVSFAGPFMNFGLAVACIIASVASVLILRGAPSGNTELLDKLLLFFGVGCALNVTLGIFNLLPAPPLDGSHILAGFWPAYRRFLSTQGGQFFGIVLFIIAFFFAGRLIGGVGYTVWSVGTRLVLSAVGGSAPAVPTP
jgi:Zn-dependent protease